MSRANKYATQRRYQAYIDVIMDDLGLTGNVYLEWRFATYTSMGGDSILYSPLCDGRRYGSIRISNECDKVWTIKAIMHELRHIQQYYQNRLSSKVQWRDITSNGKTVKTPFRYWDNVLYQHFGVTKTGQSTPEYMSLPWEIDAYAYQKEYNRLFPDGEVMSRHYIGNTDGKHGKVKFYKIKKET